MIKKHVALSLALFTAGAIYLGSAVDADAATKHRHTKCVVKHHKKQCQSYYHTHTKKKVAKKKKQGGLLAAFHRDDFATTPKRKKHYHSKQAIAKADDSVKALAAPVGKSGRTINVADDYIGLSERRSKRQLMNLFNFAFDGKIDPARTPWCAAFANGVLSKSGKRGTGSLTATSFMGWGRKTHRPSQGDIVVLKPGKRYHVGFYMGTVQRDGRTYVAVLGGNQNNSVKVTYYLARKVVAYRTAG